MAGGLVESALHDRAAPGLRLIETLRREGGGYVRLERHLARLGQSAEWLGWTCDLGRVMAALMAVAVQDARVRLTLDGAGVVAVQSSALPAAAAEWQVGLAAARLASDDPWLGVKSSNRAVHDAARAALPPGLDEMVFQNQRGEVCDGTITTLFFDRGQGMRTPPLTCGLLPGVLRAEMLAGGCLEEVLMAADLPKVRLWVGNSLRGLMRAVWVG